MQVSQFFEVIATLFYAILMLHKFFIATWSFFMIFLFSRLCFSKL